MRDPVRFIKPTPSKYSTLLSPPPHAVHRSGYHVASVIRHDGSDSQKYVKSTILTRKSCLISPEHGFEDKIPWITSSRNPWNPIDARELGDALINCSIAPTTVPIHLGLISRLSVGLRTLCLSKSIQALSRKHSDADWSRGVPACASPKCCCIYTALPRRTTSQRNVYQSSHASREPTATTPRAHVRNRPRAAPRECGDFLSDGGNDSILEPLRIHCQRQRQIHSPPRSRRESQQRHVFHQQRVPLVF